MVYIKEQLPKPMTNKELEELYKNWNEESWKVLAERNIRFAVKVANSFSNTELEEEDLFSIALLGLIKSAKKFNPSLGYKFSTFSSYVIKNEILMELRKQKRYLNPKESIDEVFVNEKGDFLHVAELIPDSSDIEDSVLFKELTSVLKLSIQAETERDQKIIIMFFNQKSQREIAKCFGISQSYVSRIVKRFKNNFEKEYRRWRNG